MFNILSIYIFLSLYYLYICNMKRYPTPFVMILSGVPMSGKSTWLKENYPDVMVISRDDILLEVAGTDDYGKAFYNTDSKLVDRKLREKLLLAGSLGQDVILDMINGSAKTRKRNLEYFSDDFYKVAVVFPVLTTEEYDRRNEFRKLTENKFIPGKVLHTMINTFTIPTEDEGFDEVIKL